MKKRLAHGGHMNHPLGRGVDKKRGADFPPRPAPAGEQAFAVNITVQGIGGGCFGNGHREEVRGDGKLRITGASKNNHGESEWAQSKSKPPEPRPRISRVGTDKTNRVFNRFLIRVNPVIRGQKLILDAPEETKKTS
jgi:hypothetical protein